MKWALKELDGSVQGATPAGGGCGELSWTQSAGAGNGLPPELKGVYSVATVPSTARPEPAGRRSPLGAESLQPASRLRARMERTRAGLVAIAPRRRPAPYQVSAQALARRAARRRRGARAGLRRRRRRAA